MTTISITLDNPGLVSSLKKMMLNINGVRDFQVTSTKETAVPKRKEEQSRRWEEHGLCSYCGGQISGFFTKKCKTCGKPR